jgi:hypothetical protein
MGGRTVPPPLVEPVVFPSCFFLRVGGSFSTSSTRCVTSDEWTVPMGGTSGGGTANSSEVTRWVLLVEEKLSTLQK